MEQKQVAAERQVLSKLEKIKLDQEQRAAVLERDAQAEDLQARLLHTNSKVARQGPVRLLAIAQMAQNVLRMTSSG